jgi:hypothetical protein
MHVSGASLMTLGESVHAIGEDIIVFAADAVMWSVAMAEVGDAVAA